LLTEGRKIPMTRIALIEASIDRLGADYDVHSQLVASVIGTPDLEVLSISNPGLRDVNTPGIERHFVAFACADGPRVTRQLEVIRDLPSAMRTSTRLIREFAPDVIYSSQQRRDVLLAGLLSRVTGVPLIVHLHYPYGPWLGRIAAAMIKRADHVMAVSEFVRETALLRGLKDERVSTIHNITAPSTGALVGRENMRQQLGIAPDARMIAVVGRLDPAKHIESLLRVLPAIVSDVPELKVVICGKSTHALGYDRVLGDLTTSLGLDDHVTFLGYRTDVASILDASDVFCLPTEMEAFGLVFIEAMRAGLPVVAVSSGGVREIVADEITGLLSVPGDLVGLEANLRRVVVDFEAARTMGNAGRERLAEVFNQRVVGERWLARVESVIANPR
jgi:glycosyltransferase involved in cell wall biosynthesis